MINKILLILSIIFGLLTFVGVGYVLINKGQVSAGYAVVPMVIYLGFLSTYRANKKSKSA